MSSAAILQSHLCSVHSSGLRHPDLGLRSLDPAGCAMTCRVCESTHLKNKGLYCRQCDKDVAACKRDAFQHGWSSTFAMVSAHPSAMQTLMRQYTVECPSGGRGKRRDAFDYHRFFHIIPSGTHPNTTGTPPHVWQSSTRASPGFDLFAYDELITQLITARLFLTQWRQQSVGRRYKF